MVTIMGSALRLRVSTAATLLDYHDGGLPLGVCDEHVGFWSFLMVAELISSCIVDFSTFTLCRPLPPSPPPSPAVATPVLVVAEELLELLLPWEEELTRREEALAAWKEKARISKKTLTKVSDDLDAERTKAEATRKEYLNKIEAHTACAKHSLDLDKMLGEKKVLLDGRERNLSLREAVLAEAHTWGLNPQDNYEEMMEFIKL
jgi:hypothetical protein